MHRHPTVGSLRNKRQIHNALLLPLSKPDRPDMLLLLMYLTRSDCFNVSEQHLTLWYSWSGPDADLLCFNCKQCLEIVLSYL